MIKINRRKSFGLFKFPLLWVGKKVARMVRNSLSSGSQLQRLYRKSPDSSMKYFWSSLNNIIYEIETWYINLINLSHSHRFLFKLFKVH